MRDESTPSGGSAGVSRRHAIKSGVASALAVTGAGWAGGLAASADAAAAGKPARGGTLTVGMITGGAAETVNPGIAIAAADTLRCAQLYDLLFYGAPDIKTLLPGLALSAEHNRNATKWTFHLRDGVHWHDGKPFGADDIVWNFTTWGSESNFNHALFANIVNFKGVRKVGRLTVEVPLLRPVAEFPSLFAFLGPFIIQNGATNAKLRAHPIGTGPFRYESFVPGTQSVFTRNPDYWEHGRPFVDKLIVNSSFTDENARLNALLGGEIQVSVGIPATVAAAHRSSSQVKLLTSHSPDPECILMRVDKGPFADVRVRQALKLIADRKALCTTALDGYATPANDLIGVGCNYYLNLPTPQQDIEKAKSLLKAAGQEHLSFSLPTSNAFPGFVEAATIYAQQCAAAGVKVAVNQIPPATYYTSAAGFLTRPICIDNGTTYTSLTALYQTWYTAYAPYNETWWGHQKGGAAAEKLIDEAISATDPHKAAALWHEVQTQEYTQGGTLAFATTDYLDATTPNVHGLKTTPIRNLNGYRLLDGWIK
jgi:peptide/nickel transport system substrate-binding protein